MGDTRDIQFGVTINVHGAQEGTQQLENFSKAGERAEKTMDSINGKEVKLKVAKGDEKRLQQAAKEAQKYLVDTKTAYKKAQEFYQKAFDNPTANNEKKFVGYYSSYLAQQGAAIKEYDEYLHSLTKYGLIKGQDGYNTAERNEYFERNALAEQIQTQLRAQQQLTAEKKATADATEKQAVAEKQVTQNTKKSSDIVAKQAKNMSQLHEQYQLLRDINKQLGIYSKDTTGSPSGVTFSRDELLQYKSEILQLNPALQQVADRMERIGQTRLSNLLGNPFKSTSTQAEIANQEKLENAVKDTTTAIKEQDTALDSSTPKTIPKQFDQIIKKTRELTKLMNELRRTNKEAMLNPNIDYSQQIEHTREMMMKLWNSLTLQQPENFIKLNQDVLDTSKIDAYHKAALEMDVALQKLNDTAPIKKMQQAYAALGKEMQNLVRLSKTGDMDALTMQNIERSKSQIEQLQTAFMKYYQQVQDVFGTEMTDQLLSPTRFTTFNSILQTAGQVIQSPMDKLDKFAAKIKETGSTATAVGTEINQMRTQFSLLADSLAFGTINPQDFATQLHSLVANLDRLEGFSSFLKLEEQINSLGTTSAGKIEIFSSKLTELKAELAQVFGSWGKTGFDKSQLPLTTLDQLATKLGTLKSLTKSFESENAQGKLLEHTIGKIGDSADLEKALMQYKEMLNLGKQIGQLKIDSNGSITATFDDLRGGTVTLKATTEALGNLGNAARIAISQTKGVGGIFSGFGTEIKSSITHLMSMFTLYDVFMRLRREFTQGIEVLKQYDAAITDMSYSMEATKDQLNDLGASAVDLAIDMSAALEDTLNIYQIYANMNTTAEEIEAIAKPTTILANLSGKEATEASDQIQGVLQQFNMLYEDGSNAAEASMHVVDVLDNIASNVSLDYVKGMQTISDAVVTTGAVAYDAGLSYEQLAAITAKVAERTREDGSTIGNAIKTITVRLSKVGKMPAYADEVSNEELSKASESLNEIGIAVYNADGSFRELDTILTELRDKWDGLTDAQQSNLAYNIAATRQTSKFKNILESWTEAMSLAEIATVSSGSAEANQEKYEQSVNGKMQKISTQWDAFWLSFLNSNTTHGVLDFFIDITGALNNLSESAGGGVAAFTALAGALTAFSVFKSLSKTLGNSNEFAPMGVNPCSRKLSKCWEVLITLHYNVVLTDKRECHRKIEKS